MTSPPVPPDADVRDFPYFPLFRTRLFASTFHAKANDSEWRAGVTLWLKSWDQSPAGSLPNDDVELCRLAELGRDLKTWRRLKLMALHGWEVCDDGRLYHHIVATIVNNALQSRAARRKRTEAATLARRNGQRNDDRNGQRNVHQLEQELEEKRTITNKGNRPSREAKASLPDARAPARVGRRGLAKKSPREVQTEAFYHAALNSQRSRNC